MDGIEPPWRAMELRVATALTGHLMLEGMEVSVSSNARAIEAELLLEGEHLSVRVESVSWWSPETEEWADMLANRLAISLLQRAEERLSELGE